MFMANPFFLPTKCVSSASPASRNGAAGDAADGSHYKLNWEQNLHEMIQHFGKFTFSLSWQVSRRNLKNYLFPVQASHCVLFRYNRQQAHENFRFILFPVFKLSTCCLTDRPSCPSFHELLTYFLKYWTPYKWSPRVQASHFCSISRVDSRAEIIQMNTVDFKKSSPRNAPYKLSGPATHKH